MRYRWRARLAAPPPQTWLNWAARFGYAACGAVYVAIGIAALAVAVGLAEEPAGSHGVMRFLAAQPLGPFVLAALGIGLAGYAALNFAGAIGDPEGRGVSPWAIMIRVVDALTGALYVALAVAALGTVIDPAREVTDVAVIWASRILSLPAGSWLLGALGLVLILSGGYLFHRAFQEKFGEMLDRRELSQESRRAIALAARAGTAARGLIFAICGLLVVRAALDSSPEIVGDAGDALTMIGEATFGPLLLAIVGAGFIAYGAYQLAKARYQRIASAQT